MNTKHFILAVAAVAFAACTQIEKPIEDIEDIIPETPAYSDTPIALTYSTVDAVETKAAQNLNEGTFDSGEGITVRVSNTGANEWTNYAFTTGEAGAMNATGTAPYYPAGAQNIDIVAFYPASAGTTFTVAADQTSDASYKASDLMFASVTNQAKQAETVNLAFAHKMAKLNVNITAGQGVSSITGLSVLNVKPTVSFDQATGVVGAADGDATSITMSNNGAVIIPAQTINGGLLSIVTDKGTATYTVADKAFEAGQLYTINITVNLRAVGTTTAITGWTSEGTVNVTPGDWTVTVSGSYTYNGSAIVPDAANITVHSTSADADIDAANYDVFINNNINAGEATLIVSGKGAYAGKVASCTYTIDKKAGTINYAVTDISKRYGDAAFINTLTKNGDGTVAFTSSNESVATVDSDGKVKIAQGATSGTATITATITPTDNFTFEDPSVTYTLTVSDVYTISQLKTDAGNGSGSEHLGYEVWSNGDLIHKDSGVTPTDASATKVGYVAYLSTSDVDNSVSGSRILVLSAVDVCNKTSWGPTSRCSSHTLSDNSNLCGYSNTSTMVNCASEHSAAQAAWNYSTAIPTGGATPAHWFLPSYKQYEVMIAAFDPNVVNNNNYKAFPNFEKKMDWEKDSYWTSTETILQVNALALYASGSRDSGEDEPIFIEGKNKSSSCRVRACFAY